MAQFTIYRSNGLHGVVNADAPVLNGTVGSLINLLDKCLVTGYGTGPTLKSAAGWTKLFPGSNKAAFKLGAGTGFYLRVDDNGPGIIGAQEAGITGYEVMSDINTGLRPFPVIAQAPLNFGGIPTLIARKSTFLDSTARPWLIAADSRTAVVVIYVDGSAPRVFSFGDFYSFKTGDLYNCSIIGWGSQNSYVADYFGNISYGSNGNIGSGSGEQGHFMARGHNEIPVSVGFIKSGDLAKQSGFKHLAGSIPFTNPADGGIYLSPMWISDPVTSPGPGIRGRVRGLWIPLHPAGSFVDGDTFSGGATGELSGKTFLAISLVLAQNSEAGSLIIETSNSLETN